MKALYLFIILTMITACTGIRAGVYSGSEWITSPEMELFGAEYAVEDGDYRIEAYFESRIKNRTEYIYENLNLTFPVDFEPDTDYTFTNDGVEVLYAKGGQVGQLESNLAEGTFSYNMVGSAIKVELNARFSDFITVGYVSSSNTEIFRTGTLNAVLKK